MAERAVELGWKLARICCSFKEGKCRWFGFDSTEMVVFGLPTELAMAGMCRADMVGGDMVAGLGPHGG
jgi:hypothetical protein